MFHVDMMSRTPVYEQIIEQAERYILNHLLKSGDKLPSVRQLSVELSINPNTIQKAYTELDRRGVICSVPGKGCFVAENALEIISQNTREKMKELIDIVNELQLAGITKEQIVECINEAFSPNSDKEGISND